MSDDYDGQHRLRLPEQMVSTHRHVSEMTRSPVLAGLSDEFKPPQEERDSRSCPRSDSETSLHLLNRAKAMDEDAWATIVEVYTPLINFWVRRKGINKQHDIENTRQDVFLKLARYLNSFHKNSNKGAFRKWLRTITNNLALTAHKQNQDIVLGGSVGADMFNNILEDEVSILESVSSIHALESTILFRSIMKWIESRYSEVQVGIFSGLVLHGRRPKDLAEDLNVSLYTVYHTKSRILKRVREEFGRYV